MVLKYTYTNPKLSFHWRWTMEKQSMESVGAFALIKAMEYCTIFMIGALVYYGIEILWRGYSHWTMAVVGGIALIIVGLLNEGLLPQKWGLIPQMICGGLIITVIEFIAGCILNIWLGLSIWDYSNSFGNILGQVCLLYTFLWMLLSGVAIVVDDAIRHVIFKEKRPHYDLWYCHHDHIN